MGTKYGVVILVILASVAATQVIHRNKLEEGLLKLIEKCKKGEVSSLPIALPSLKTLKLPPFEEHIEDHTIHLSELQVDGLENMSILTLTASESRKSLLIELNVPKIAARADSYTLRVSAIFGLVIPYQGVLTANIDNLRATADVRFARQGNDTVINKLDLSYSVKSIQVHLSGSNSIVNDAANKLISAKINDHDFRDKVRENIIHIAKGYLQGHTPDELIDIISAL